MSSRISFLIAVFLLLGLTVVMFGEVLFTQQATLLSRYGTDLSLHFIHWRGFGFSQLRKGNFALWNPHIFSGTPYFGELQSALLYPPNLLYLILPLPKAVNFSITLHIFLAGLFMYLWTFHRRLHPLACFLSSVLLMFCGAHFMHIYAGHLPHLCAMIWTPLLLLSIDGFLKKRSMAWFLLGVFAITMQILAGHPQYFFYSTVCALIYSGLCIIKTKQGIKAGLGLIGMYVGAMALGAVQLLSVIETAAESVRSSGLPYKFAAVFSFPPENLITLFVPGFFGNMKSIPYWGRCNLWEMLPFVSITGLVLAGYASIYGNRDIRRFSTTMALILLVLALGRHTPLFKVLYYWVPGFGRFRGSSKFIFYASCFIIMLAGIGLDHIIRQARLHRSIVMALFIIGILFGSAALCIEHSVATNSLGWWQRLMQAVYATYESYLPKENYLDLNFIKEAGLFASGALRISASTCLVLLLLFLLTKSYPRLLYAVVLLAMVEIFIFAKSSLATFDFALTRPPELKTLSDNYPGDYRILNLHNPNSVISFSLQNIWGYDWSVSRRYAEFMAFTQGQEPNQATEYVKFSQFHQLYSMIRCRFPLLPKKDRMRIIDFKNIMPPLALIQDWLLITDRDQIFATMENAEFDPSQKVILETVPEPEPVKSNEKGTAKIIDSSTDHLTIEAELKQPAILLITDGYSRGWQAKALSGSAQKRYRVMPANYILKALPLSKGYHRIRLEYLPLAFQVGKWISILSVIIYVGLLGYYCTRRYRAYQVKS